MRALGPFVLDSKIGSGGMAEVWKARHSDTAQQVAIKFLAHPDRSMTAFRAEVDAMARLDHPNIVRIHDYGTLQERLKTPAGHTLDAGVPFIVMDLASGSIVDNAAPTRWSEVRALALDVLAGLTHAHARGVTHRDLKPANILTALGPEPRLLLSDFGIAVAARSRAHASGAMSPGTPTHMAPELFRGTWRRYGPWTDLYALAIIVWQLTTGSVPFRGNFFQIASGHLDSELPAFEPRFPVPHGVLAWLERNLAKTPGDRFQFAAHAAEGLRSLGNAGTGATRALPALGVETTPTIITEPEDPENFEMTEGSLPPTEAEDGHEGLGPGTAAMLGTGLSLLGLRPPPFIGREGARRALWSALQATVLERIPRAVVLRGLEGVGKRRLAHWLAHSAHERGVARIARVQFRAGHSGVREAVTAILRDHFRTWDLTGRRVQEAIDVTARGTITPVERDLLQQLLDPTHAGHAEVPLGVLRHALGVCARRSGQVIVLEDVHHAPDAVNLVEEVLRTESRAALLFVLTQAAGQGNAQATASLRTHPRATVMEIPALATGTVQRLLERELGLTTRLSREVANRSEGIPLFAVEYVLDLARRGALRRVHGRLEATVDLATLPASLHELSVQRIQGVAQAVGAGARPALHMMAALGEDIDVDLWRRCCQDASISIPRDLADALVAQRLARPTSTGLKITTRVILESLVELAKQAGAWSRNCRLAANRLQSNPATLDDPRIGPLLLHAQLHRAALPTLIRSARRHVAEEEYTDALEALRLVGVAAKALSLPEMDDRVIEANYLRGQVYFVTEQPDRALEYARLSLEAATLAHNEARLPASATLMASILEQLGELRTAAAAAQRAVDVARHYGHPRNQASALSVQARIANRMGDTEGCLRSARASLRIALDHKLDSAQCAAHYMLGWVLTTTREYPEAVQHFTASMRLAERLGANGKRSIALSGLAEVQRFRGQVHASIETYRECIELQTACGVFDAVNHVNLGLALATAQLPEEALEPLGAALAWAKECGRKMVTVCAQIALAWAHAQIGDWDETLQQVSAGVTGLDRIGLVERDVAVALYETARLLTRADRTEVARQLTTVALRQWTALGCPEPETTRTRALHAKVDG